MENIFIKQYIEDFTNIQLEIKHNRMLDVQKFVNKINENPGYIFILNRFNDKVYIGEIIKISSNYDELIDYYKIKIQGKKFFLKILDSLQMFEMDVLEMVYSKNQRKNLGDKQYSLKNTYQNRIFNFATPIIFNYDFLLINLSSDDRRNLILEDSSFFNESNQNKIYGKFLEEDGSYFFSLINRKMIEEDGRNYSPTLIDKKMMAEQGGISDDSNENYRPYFYEFYIEKVKSAQIRELQIGDIYEVQITNNYYKIEEEIELFKGKLFFSASPLVEIPAKLIIKSKLSDSEKQKINESETILRELLKGKKVNAHSLIGLKLMEKFPASQNIEFEVTIYNVGQGNWSKINATGSDGSSLDIIYDIGMGSSKNVSLTKKIARKAASEIIDNHIFILSHWDLDHIKGIINLSENQFNTIWIVPDLPNTLSFPAIRLALFLYKSQRDNVVFVSDELYNQQIFSNKYIALGKGEGKELGKDAIRNGHTYKTSYTVNNNIGLVLSIRNNDKSILFTGDCEYIQLPNEFLNKKYYAIVMAHHGAKIKYKDLAEIGMIRVSNPEAKAYVCVGKDVKYPDKEHNTAIEQLGFNIVETRAYTAMNNQIKISLRRQ